MIRSLLHFKTSTERFSFDQYWACSAILLILVTWPVWWPGGEVDRYPSLPWVSILESSDVFVWLRIFTIGCLACLFAVVTQRMSPKLGWIGVVICLGWSFLMDQHRLQPWAYQTAIYAVVFASCNQIWKHRLLTLLAASVYFYSGLGKLDFQFAHTVGQEFLRLMLSPVREVLPAIDPVVTPKLALLFPAIEISAAMGLMVKPLRIWASWILIAMHGMLILILGPWAADHSAGVLVWNAILMGQAYLLFIRSHDSELRQRIAGKHSFPIVAASVVGLAMVAPIGERWGYWDHWLSWSLYSPHTSRASIQLHASCLDRLPMELRDYVLEDRDGDRWHRLSIENWSLESRRVPIYPQARYQLQLARWIAKAAAIDREIRVTKLSVSDRWTGVRQEKQLLGKRNLWD